MKCPSCSTNHRRRRDGMRCSCGYTFVFDPQINKDMRDGRMNALINKVSANNTRFFTLNLLYGTYLRQPKINKGCFIIVFIISLLLIAVPFLIAWGIPNNGLDAVFIGFLLLFFTSMIYLFQHYSKPMDMNIFADYFSHWQHNSQLKSNKFIEKTALQNPPPRWNESDIYNYGVEKVIILDDDLSVDLWIKNNEHVNQKALILSSDGYPSYLIEQLKTILSQQPEINIFSLHGLRTTLHREAMRFQTATEINLENYHFVDLGFNKKQIQKSKRLNHAYNAQNYDIPLDMLPYACGMNMLAWTDDAFAQNHLPLSNRTDRLDVEFDFDDFDFG